MSAEAIIRQLTAANQELEQAHTKAMAAAENAAKAHQLVTAALQGSGGQLAATVNQTREALAQSAQRVPTARQKIQETIAKVQALGN